MNKCKKLIPLLAAVLMLFLLMTTAYADSANVVEVKSGSKEAKVTFTVEKVLALEATASTRENVGFKVKGITAKVSEKSGFQTYIGDKGNQVVVIGESVPANITLTVDLVSSSPMRNGVYYVTLNYGRTNFNGTYNANRALVAAIYVGIEAPDENDSKATLSETKKPTEQQKNEEPEVTVTEPGEEPNRTDLMGMLDLSALRSALEEAEKLKASGRLDEAQMALLQEAIDAAEEALNSDRQGAIDDAAYELFAVIEALGGPVTDAEKKPQKDRSEGGGLILPLILALVAILGITGILMYLRRKKKRRVLYEGAPIVDYEIGDDDVL